MTRGTASLALEGVTKRFGSATAVVDDLRLDVAAGTMLGLLGPSGCGKTTVLRMIAGLVPVSSGTIRIDGADVTGLPPHRRDIGMVFQQYALFPHLTVDANVAFGLEMRALPAHDVRERVEQALDMVRLPGLGRRMPAELSGGQQQRVALARALVVQPKILLLDEPLSNLDARLRDELREEIREIQQRLAITTVFVTHDQIEALTMCDTVGVMSHGRLIQTGTPADIYERPVSRRVAEFVGRVNTAPCDVVAPGLVRLGGQDCSAVTVGVERGPATATIRPHHILLAAPGHAPAGNAVNLVPATITRAAYVGDLVQYDVTFGQVSLKVETHASRHAPRRAVGDAVVCEWSTEDMLVFRD